MPDPEELITMEQIAQGLFRLLVPFEELTTTVYVALCPTGVALIDAATTQYDAEQLILPALRESGIAPTDVRYLLLTHDHGDHAGGAPYLLEHLPHATLRCPFDSPWSATAPLFDGEVVAERLQTVHLPGHTAHSVGFLDLPTRTLLSGDCLQLGGVGKYRSGITRPDDYRISVHRLMDMELSRIVAAHEYDPLGSIAEGTDAVRDYLTTCLSFLPDQI